MEQNIKHVYPVIARPCKTSFQVIHCMFALKILGNIKGCLDFQYRKNTVGSRYLEIEGTIINTSRYPYFDISDL